MIGLEKTKARMGEVSQSARALSLEDMHRLYDACLIQSSLMAKSDGGPYNMLVFFCVIIHWSHRMNVIACLPLSISHDSSH